MGHLRKSEELARETEQFFRDWTVLLAGEPRDRHKKKFAFEKLEKTFKDEVTAFKCICRRAMAARKRAADIELLSNTSSSSSDQSPTNEEVDSLLGKGGGEVDQRQSQEDVVMMQQQLDALRHQNAQLQIWEA